MQDQEQPVPAVRKLREHLTARGITPTAFAPLIGKSPSTISRILAGEVKPTYEVQVAIRDKTGGAVQPNDWYPPERPGFDPPQRGRAA